MPFFEIRKSVPYLAKRLVGSIDYRRDFSRLHKVREERQIVMVQLRHKETELLTRELRH